MPALPSRSTMERAYLRSDGTYDGVFYLGVRTTGIFCRPSCGARKPQPKNVDFFSTVREALFAGYRPCKRCSPLTHVGATPPWVKQILTIVDRDTEQRLTDAALRAMGIDPARARRFFLKNYGMTFQAYCRGRRLGRALEQIRRGKNLDDVALGHGYESHSGFRDAFSKAFGTSPGRATSTDCIFATWIETPLGPLIAGATKDKLVLVEFTDRRMLNAQFVTLRKIYKRPIVPGSNTILEQLRSELAQYFEGGLKKFTVPLEFPGSEFQRRVWKGLVAVPYGTTLSYEDLAKRIGAPRAQRAVGHANGLNRIAIVVPCHRVVNKDGRFGGYGGGVWRKRALLELEQGTKAGIGGSTAKTTLAHQPAKGTPKRDPVFDGAGAAALRREPSGR